MPKYVLIIEDDLRYLKIWRQELEDDEYIVTSAESIETALRVFPEQQWDAIAVDGCIGGENFNSPPLIRKFRAESKEDCSCLPLQKIPIWVTLWLRQAVRKPLVRKGMFPA